MNFFLLNDRNVMYEFHTYAPMAFTHQDADWIDAMKDVDSAWPDRPFGKQFGWRHRLD